MKTIIFFIFILTLNANVTKSQIIISEPPPQVIRIEPSPKPIDYRIPIIKVLGRHMNTKRLLETPKNHAYVFSISLSFNEEGKIDTVYFSDKMSSNLKEIIKPGSSLSDALRAIDFKNEFINKVVLLPIVLKRWEDDEIDNAANFLRELTALWPKMELKDKSKKVVFLDPFINLYTKVFN